MAPIALPSFLNQANRVRASAASTSNGEIDFLTGTSGTFVGTGSSLEPLRSAAESNLAPREQLGRPSSRFMNPPILADIILRIAVSDSSSQTIGGDGVVSWSIGFADVVRPSSGSSTQTIGGDGVVSWSIGFADVVRPSSSSASFPITPSDGRIRGTLLL